MSIIASEIKEISDGVILFKQAVGDSSYDFFLEVNRLSSIEICSDFSSSENIYLEGVSSLCTTSVVHPFTKTKIASMKLLNEWRIKSKFTCKILDPPKAIILDAMKKERNEIKLKLDNLKGVLAKVYINLSPLNEIEKILQSNSTNFIDNDFPPVDFIDKVSFAWRRLSHAYPGCLLLPKRIEPFDVLPGEGKDHWIRNALLMLSERPATIERLFITKQSNPYGIYRVKLCKNNAWEIVTVDEYVPFLISGASLLCHTVDNAYWASILEKAYCKLYSSYDILNFKSIIEIMDDLTGCPCDLYTLTGLGLQDIWDIIHENTEKGYLCALYNDNFDNIEVFTVLRSEIIEDRGIIFCRNAYNKEWLGKWASNSKLWTGSVRAKVNPSFNDSSFWAELDEVSESFDRLLICKLGNWHEFRQKGKFVKTDNKVISSTYFSIIIEESELIIIKVQQEDERDIGVMKTRGYLDIGIVVLKIDAEDSVVIVGRKELVIEKSCAIELELEPGEYIILPITSGCLLQSPAEISPEKTKLFTAGWEINPLLDSTANSIFSHFDSKDEKLLKYEKFKKFAETIGKPHTELDFKQKILKKHLSKDEGLTLTGFKSYFFDLLKQVSEETAWSYLESLGYDRDLYSVDSRLFFLSIHSNLPLQILVRTNVCELEDQINAYLIQTHGIEIENKGGVKVMYYLYEDVHCYLYGICNFKEEGIEAVLDCSESENMVFSYRNATTTKFIGPGALTFMLSALALPNAETFVRSARCTW